MIRPWVRALVLTVMLALAGAAAADDTPLERARAILRETPLIDGHNDLPWQIRDRFDNHLEKVDLEACTRALDPTMHTDIGRLREGGVGAQFWSVYIPVELTGGKAVRATLEQIDVVHRMIERWPGSFGLALTADDVERVFKSGRVASLIGVEGGHSIGESLGALRMLYATGARYMTLTHWKNTQWADAATDAPAHGGLSPFGEEVVREMNRLGMLVDLSHVSEEAMADALDVSAAPVIFSHSSARAVCGHVRNVPDAVLARMPANGGIVMVNFSSGFVSEKVRQWYAKARAERARQEGLHPGDPGAQKQGLADWKKEHPEPRATLAQVADHLDHIRRVAGPEHVGIGSDFDGISDPPRGLDDVASYPALLAELLRRGWSEEDVARLAGENVLRVMQEAEQVAARLRRERPASSALIEELDGKRSKAGRPRISR